MPTHDAGVRRWLLLLSVCLTGILTPLCFTGPAVVLPSIHQVLGGTPSQLNWVINGYILTYGSLMMAAGSLADTYGRKRVWLLGLMLFIVVTFAIPYAPSILWMDALRLLQGAGGAIAFAGGVSTLAQVFHGSLRTRAFSILGTCFGVALAFGPLVAGWLTDTAGWRWVFLATGLLSIISLILAFFTADESRDPQAMGLDWPGAISFSGFLTLLTYGLLLVPEHGWADTGVIISLAATVVLFIAFVIIERYKARPMLDLSLFSNARFIGIQILGASPAFFYITLIVILPVRFISVDGYNALEAGQLMVTLSAPLLVVPFIAGILARWLSAGVLSGIGLLILALGLFWLGKTLAGGAADGALLWPMMLIGIGIGLPWGLMDSLAVSVVEKERAGMATGIFNAVRVSADGVALAVLGALLAARIHAGLSDIVSDAVLRQVASRAAIGDVAGASALLPGLGDAVLHSYDSAFQTTLFLLSSAAVLTALLIFALLGHVHAHDEKSVSTKSEYKPSRS
ncbi:tetracenomycin C resistance and export protein [Xenorhabdus mauleonii]|uniref:Major Facilitator Superfamily protein n=1 Tax=Xenorhabdus mauleonii TaxID=351675 RepID=A0A1I3T1W8_9GAMM|nr:MFS transporter [Xenorhabdus mauleonii]PHM44664.1 tetracenomycin C resistance and export protein [Xenorhabdus mauleonii]SFJ63537.1 Major Facilitator Superfamily protein [Xenorhabdus mauleonii]